MRNFLTILLATLLACAAPLLAHGAEKCAADMQGKVTFLEPSMEPSTLNMKYPPIVRSQNQEPYESAPSRCWKDDVFVFRGMFGVFASQEDATAAYHAYVTLWALGQTGAAEYAAKVVGHIEEERIKAYARLRK